MDSLSRAPAYDLFKLIIAVMLLILAMILMGRSPAQAPESIATAVSASRQPTIVSASSMPPSFTATSSLTSPTAAASSVSAATPLPSPTETPMVEATGTPVAEIPVTACEAATSRSHLQTGKSATIRRRLNFRSSPGIRDNWLLTNVSGTQVEIIGGPECVPYSNGAYLWWQIKLPDGRVGWSAEESVHGIFYFMEPVK